MRDPISDRADMAERRREMLSASYRLFTEKSITSVTLEEIAKEAGCGKRTLLRYYDTKVDLVIAVAAFEWELFLQEHRKFDPGEKTEQIRARDIFEFYLDSFLELYRKRRDLLRFNQLFNVYLLSEGVASESLDPYDRVIEGLRQRFHKMYELAKSDHTIRTDIPETEMFCTTLHLMLAVVTRYAVGLVYQPQDSFDAEKELLVQKEALMLLYSTGR